MFFEVLSLMYHSPITIELLIYGVLLGMRQYSSRHIRNSDMRRYRSGVFGASDGLT